MAAKAASQSVPRVLLYGGRGRGRDERIETYEHTGYTLVHAPLGSSVSFLDYDAVVVWSGEFEDIKEVMGYHQTVCIHQPDRDLREREVWSGLTPDRFVLFMVTNTPVQGPGLHVNTRHDLFRSIASAFDIRLSDGNRCPVVASQVAELTDYVRRFGTGYIRLSPQDSRWNFKVLCSAGENTFGLAVGESLFFLPTTVPKSVEMVLEICNSAVTAVLAYRNRVSREFPSWIGGFAFAKERDARAQSTELHRQAYELDQIVGTYEQYKGVLCFQSTPLVESIDEVMRRFFDIELTREEKFIDDATIVDEGEQTIAVLEIKGIKGNFARQHVNQVDSHRERLGLPSSVPGIVIINTIIDAQSLAEKDQSPHPDVITKAVSDNVLLIRTIDLLRFADLVERGTLSKESLLDFLLTKRGWLKVDDKQAVVIDK